MFIILKIVLIKTIIISSNQSSVDDMAAVARGDGQTRSCFSFLPFDVVIVIVIIIAILIVVVIVLATIIILLSVVQGETIKRVCLLSYRIRDNHENCLHRSVLIFAGATMRKEAVNISSSQDRRRTKFEEEERN